jgi:hypothetical protein
MGRECSTHGSKGNSCRIFLGMPEAKRPLRRPGHRLEDNIKMDVEFSGMNWINLAEDTVQWLALVNRFHKFFCKFLSN